MIRLIPCPECGFLLEPNPDAPGGVARHGCGMFPEPEVESSPRSLAMAAASDPSLTMEGAGLAFARLVLMQAAETGEVPGDPGSTLDGMARFVSAGGSDDSFAQLMELLRGDE